MANERTTEALTEKLFKFHVGQNESFSVGAQAPIATSKTGKSGKGRAEYLIHFKDYPKTVAVIECKAKTAFHQSDTGDKPRDYAVDGVLSYAETLKADYDVIALAVSGTENTKMRVSCFFWRQGAEAPVAKTAWDDKFLPITKYPENWRREDTHAQINIGKVRDLAISFHNKLREAKLSEKQKPIFIAGILIALEDSSFRSSYRFQSDIEALSSSLADTLERVLRSSNNKTSEHE